MKVRIKDTIYEFVSAETLTLKEAMRIKMATGLNLMDLYNGAETGDPFAIAAMVWIIRIRDGEKDLKFDDVDFPFGDFEFLPDETPEPAEAVEAVEAVEADPTTPDPV